MRTIVLASGSGGNVTYIEHKQTTILIDCGISYRQIVQRLQDNQLSLNQLNGILITHEHGDHIKGLDVLLKRHDIVAYMTEETYLGIPPRIRHNLDATKITFITPYEAFPLGDLVITPASISHDASDAVGYIITFDDKKLVYVTDIGYLPKRDHDLFAGANIYIFESNYDVTMLFTSKRPFYLKQRIDSVKGHMSNTDSAYNLAQLVTEHTSHIILAHRSKECNTDELVLSTYRDVFLEYGLQLDDYTIVVAKQDMPTTIFEL
jgi:phosphoribosyl 1,2-cyclic phosphodiesterase